MTYKYRYILALALLLIVGKAVAQVHIMGSVYGGGKLADVQTNTVVNMGGGTVDGNVFGGGKGSDYNYLCDKAMVGVINQGAGQNPSSEENKDKGTKVTITAGTVGTLDNGTLVDGTGNVYGGGEIGRVEWNTQVKIGVENQTEGANAPVIYGSVFGAGAGNETHGFAALVRGNSTVVIQGKAKVQENVYGGGEKATAGRYWVKGIDNHSVSGETQPTAPGDDVLPSGMPYATRGGGVCTVTVQDNAQIGPDAGASPTAGHVFGAGKGVNPHFSAYNAEDEEHSHSSRRMADTGEWEYFEDDSETVPAANRKTGNDKYLLFLQTLALATETHVTISETAQVKGSVYGGSEKGFVQDDTDVIIQAGTIGTSNSFGNVFGGGKGVVTFAEAGKVKGNTKVTINGGTMNGTVYGGGELGDVGTITKTDIRNYSWEDNTGTCEVKITGATAIVEGNVFGAGKGEPDTFWCEKAMASNTSVSITNGTVNHNVYGGGEKGRVEHDTEVTIGPATGECTLDIQGSVFGAGKGVVTHGYSALVRGNTSVTVQSNAVVEKSVYGGGEIASVGKYGLDVKGMPSELKGGGDCIVTIKGAAQIGTNGGGNVFGAGKGETPAWVYNSGDKSGWSKRMMTYNSSYTSAGERTKWDYSDDTKKYVWEYFPSQTQYSNYLETLALATNPTVTIGETGSTNTINGSVYGGGEVGISKGAVIVNINGGTITKDVYGGGALADTNTGNWSPNKNYVEATTPLVEGETYFKQEDVYTEITDELAEAEEGETYYTKSGETYVEASVTPGEHVTGMFTKSIAYIAFTYEAANTPSGTYYETEGGWTNASGTAWKTTTVNLLGGEIHGDAYGGGLGQKTGFNSATSDVPAVVWGDINVTLGAASTSSSATKFYITDYDDKDIVKSGRIFGCNNLLGSPQGDVTVRVYRTVEGSTPRTVHDEVDTDHVNKNATEHTYEVAAVYGGGNLADFTTIGKKANVIIETCDVSIESVYGGGNAAEVPGTDVLVKGAYEINEVFGGGNGKDQYTTDGGTTWVNNPGANVGNADNPGNANTLLTGGYVHNAYGGSNEQGTIYGSVTIDMGTGSAELGTNGACTLEVEKLVGAGKNADVNGNLILVMGCKPSEKIPLVYGGADNANVNGNVELTITSGNFGQVFGGNNEGGSIKGHIKLNIEETGNCDTPITIDDLYLGGNQAAYSIYGYYVKTEETEAENGNGIGAATETAILEKGKLQLLPRESATDTHLPVNTYAYDEEHSKWTWTTYPITGSGAFESYPEPVLNIISCTKIGQVFGGGYGAGAAMYADPTVNINMIPGSKAALIDRDGNNVADGDATLLGEIGDVFGGGNAAAVYGTTTVNIGTAETVDLVSTAETDVSVKGAYITGGVYGGGNLADVTGNTFVNICAKKETDGSYTSVAFGESASGVTIGGDVFGGGKGKADTFTCEKAMIGTNDAGLNANYTDGNTNVVIGNGTINGTVYGGGQIGRVERNTTVTIGLGEGTATGAPTSAPEIKGNVFGGGAGEEEHGYAALVRGNPTVTIQGNAKVRQSVYGGGEIASVARYKVPQSEDDVQAAIDEGYTEAALGMPYALKDASSGTCTVIVRGYAEIGPETAMQMTKAGGPDDTGYVFGAGKGILPGGKYEYANGTTKRMVLYDATVHTTVGQEGSKWQWVDPDHSDTNKNVWEYFADLNEYIKFIQTLALSSRTYVTITDNAFVKGSVYGGSENGIVQFNTDVKIQGGQIGCGKDETEAHPDDYWTTNSEDPTKFADCSSWEFKEPYDSYDPYAKYKKEADGKYYYNSGYTQDAAGGAVVATDGHTYYGNVFGGGSGSIPYFDATKGQSVYLHSAGQVKGNTNVTISGGHILTNVYGGCETTNVEGTANVTMTGGTVGVPRTDEQIIAHPLTGYIFGGGKGDQRIFFNKDTNVKDAVVTVEGGRVYGSVYGGGEDGHVLRNVTLTIGKQTTTGEGDEAVTTTSGLKIGTKGTSYYDGHVFGGGRGFGGDALTAGNVGGSVDVNILDGEILGSVYGGGRLASVGYGLYLTTENGYGEMRADNEYDGSYTNPSTDPAGTFFNKGRGHINMTISGGTIGNDNEYAYDANNQLSHTKGGNVFAGGMGRMYKLDGTTPISSLDWWKLGCVKSTKLTITGGTIKSNVYGGGELGMVQGGNHTSENNNPVSTEIIINGGTIGTEVTEKVNNVDITQYTFGSVFGGGYGSLTEKLDHTGSTNPTYSTYKYTYPKYIAGRVKGSTEVTMTDGEVLASVYGGGEMAAVGESKVLATSTDPVVLGETLTGNNGTSIVANTYVTISGGTIGKSGFGGAKMGNVYGGGSGHNNTVRSGHVYGNTNVTINEGSVSGEPKIHHNVYGGGAYGSVGDFVYTTTPEAGVQKVSGITGLHTERTNTGTANVTIKGGTIGYDGKNNGMVFGSSRGDINKPEARDDYTAWVYNANVTIGVSGTPAQGTEGEVGYVPATDDSGPNIKGSVYGSGENGHTFNNTVVTVNGGTIGIASNTDPGYTVTSSGKQYAGAAYPYRGNVYGGGCGTDKYYSDHSLENHSGEGDSYNPLAGIVYGTTTVNINGGTVVRNVYGAGAMGSVGKATTTNDVTTVTGGTTTISVSGGTIGVDGTAGEGNVFGAARGDVDATSNEFALVRKETGVSITGGTVKGNVYGGGELGCVGTFTISSDYRTFTWQDTDGVPNTDDNDKNTGICKVEIDGSSTVINGHVFGAGKGKDDTFWCEKGIVYSTNVSVKNGSVGTLQGTGEDQTLKEGTGNVYGGGEVGRVETNTEVKVGNGAGTSGGASAPTILGSVFGGGAGVETHGYSALVRGNTTVTLEGNAGVGHNVYGGGEIASVGKYGLDGHNMPSILKGGGYCYVTVQGHATIGASVFGAGEGVTPHFDNTNADRSKRSRRMSVHNTSDFPEGKKYPASGYTWEYYEDYPQNYSGTKFVWDYLPNEDTYSTYLETLALATHPEVTIDGNTTVSESVFGGGELGLTKGSVVVNIQGGTITKDVYGGGSLANTNTTTKADLNDDGELEDVTPTTTVNLLGGTINRNVYGGGLGRLASATVDAVEAKVYGDVSVKLNEPSTPEDETSYGDCEVKGTIFGCNNLNGSPQNDVTVHIWKTVTKSGGSVQTKPEKNTKTYELNAVYGGGNLATYYPDDATAREKAKANVIIDGCGLTSIKTVYGGGNAASVPATEVTVNGTYEIGQVFGGGNGADNYELDGIWYQNPGANVGYLNYTHWETASVSSPGTETQPYQLSVNNTTADEDAHPDDPDYKDASSKAKREANYKYGTGKAHATIYGGTVHEVYGGSNTRGNVRVEARTTLEDEEECQFDVGEAYGGGRNAPMDGDAVLDIGCIRGMGKAYGGAADADVNGNVVLNITNGTYGQVFGGNDAGGAIRGSITVNIQETGCNPIVIGELYGGGNEAAYSVYGYETDEQGKAQPLTSLPLGGTKQADPQVNIYSFTSIGTIYGGGYGETATMVGNPTVNIDVYEGKYAEKYNNKDNVIDEDAKVVGSTVTYSESDNGFPIPSHAKGAIGAIGTVFGGGNAAKVIGNTMVNVGTKTGEDVYEVVVVPVGQSVAGYYTRTGDGTTEHPYTYSDNPLPNNAVADSSTTYCQKKIFKGVDIRGNVYGGGNAADVTGDTKVQIGKKVTE